MSPPENSPKPLAQPPVDAGLTGTAIHVPRRRALDASKVGRSDDGPLATTSAKTDSVAVGAEDDTVLSKAVEQFYTGRQQDSGSVKVFSHYSTSLCYSPLPTCLPASEQLTFSNATCRHQNLAKWTGAIILEFLIP